MSNRRLRFMVEYQHPQEWNLGVLPGAGAGDQATQREIVEALRSMAFELESGWRPDAEVGAVAYPPFGGSA